MESEAGDYLYGLLIESCSLRKMFQWKSKEKVDENEILVFIYNSLRTKLLYLR